MVGQVDGLVAEASRVSHCSTMTTQPLPTIPPACPICCTSPLYPSTLPCTRHPLKQPLRPDPFPQAAQSRTVDSANLGLSNSSDNLMSSMDEDDARALRRSPSAGQLSHAGSHRLNTEAMLQVMV